MSYEAVQDCVEITEPPQPFRDQLKDALGDSRASFKMLMEQFLKGRGNPCPDRLADVQPHFHAVVPVDRIEDSDFCMKMLTWAVTGALNLQVGSSTLKVKHFCICVREIWLIMLCCRYVSLLTMTHFMTVGLFWQVKAFFSIAHALVAS